MGEVSHITTGVVGTESDSWVPFETSLLESTADSPAGDGGSSFGGGWIRSFWGEEDDWW